MLDRATPTKFDFISDDFRLDDTKNGFGFELLSPDDRHGNAMPLVTCAIGGHNMEIPGIVPLRLLARGMA